MELGGTEGKLVFLLAIVLNGCMPADAMEAEWAEQSGNKVSDCVTYDQIKNLPSDLIPCLLNHMEPKDCVFAAKQLLMEIKKGRQTGLANQVGPLKTVYKRGTRALAQVINRIFCPRGIQKKEEGTTHGEREAVALIEDGADVNCPFSLLGGGLRSAFEIAIDFKYATMLKAAIRAGAWFDSPMNYYGSTPLAHVCALFMRERVLSNLNPKEREVSVAWQRSALVIKVLLEAGADSQVPVKVYNKTRPAYEWLSTDADFKLLLKHVKPGRKKYNSW